MLLEILFREDRISIAIDIHRYGDVIVAATPFTSRVSIWKHEIYFSTPIELTFSEEDYIYRVERGGVYYWPPEKALCLFHGFSHSYTPVIYIGRIVDPLNMLFSISGGEVEVSIHRIDERFSHIVEILKKLGYTVATPIRGGERVVTAYSQKKNNRYSYIITVEDYGMYIESEGIAKYRDDIISIRELQLLRDIVKNRVYSRVDISEDGYIVITATVRNVDELPKAINDIETTLNNIPIFTKV